MESNVGKKDKLVRFVLAVVITILGVYFKSWWGFLAIVPLLTGVISFCPMYKIVGINTCKVKAPNA